MSKPKTILVHSRNTAEKSAIDLLAYSSAVFPNSDGVLNLASGRLIELGVEFAVSARRCFEVDKSKVTINAQRFQYSLDSNVHLEKDLRKALNGIIHARNLDIHFCESKDKIFMDDGNVVALHFIYETDRYPTTYVDIFGMAWAFLTFGLFDWESK
jgi:hypothetical protein